jgi:hypothetical protein
MAITTTIAALTPTWVQVCTGPGAFVLDVLFDNPPVTDNVVVQVRIAATIPSPSVIDGIRLDYQRRSFGLSADSWTATDKAWARTVSGSASLVVVS